MDLFVVKTERINYLCAVNVVKRLLKINSFGFGRQKIREGLLLTYGRKIIELCSGGA